MSLRLFYAPHTRASRPRWLLEEMGLPHELVRVDPKNKPQGYEALHPLSHVPVLQDGEVAMFESAAICLYIAEKDPAQGFVPPAGTPERAHYYQWMFYVMTEIEPLLALYEHETQRRPVEERDPKRIEAIQVKLGRGLRGLADGLGERTTLVGERLTAVDIVAAAVLAWARSLKLLTDFPSLLAYTERLVARDAYKRARNT